MFLGVFLRFFREICHQSAGRESVRIAFDRCAETVGSIETDLIRDHVHCQFVDSARRERIHMTDDLSHDF